MPVLIIALAPVAALGIYFYHRDKYEKEPLSLLLKAFFWGVLITILAGAVESFFGALFISSLPPFLRILAKSFFLGGFVEELCKYTVFMWLIYDNKEFNEPYDGILYAVMIALGFAALENVMYIGVAASKSGEAGMYSLGIARGVLSVPGHVSWGAVMGYYLSLARFSATIEEKNRYLFKGLFLAVLLHGLYDFLVFTMSALGSAFVIITCIYTWKFVFKAINIEEEASPFKER